MARISFDFDDTLLQTVPDEDQGLIEAGPNEPIIALMREHKEAGDTVLIVTSRCERFEGVVTHGWTERMAIADFVVKHDLPADFIIFTNGEDKAPMLVTLGVTKHFDDDAAVTIAAARQAEDQLAGLLAAESDVLGIEEYTRRIVSLYNKTKQQGAEIQSAMAGAKGAIDKALGLAQTANINLKLARGVVASSAKAHLRMKPANDDLTSAERYIGKGDLGVQQAQTALASTRHLDARRLADVATGSYQSSVRQSAVAVGHCNTLDAEQSAFESKLDELASVRSRYARKMNGYGSYKRPLADVQQPRLGGINDYQQLINDLDTQEARWRAETRRAERAYEAEQTRLRRIREEDERRVREAEAARRRERQRQADAAAARRRRDSYSSSSSSSSGSFGGGGYGGSSGGFGGGGYGGSSGSF